MNKTMTRLLCICLLGLAGELSAKPLYEVVSAEIYSDAKVREVIAELRGKDNGAAIFSGDRGSCMTFDSQKTDFSQVAGLDCVLRLLVNERGLVAGYGTTGGWQGIVDYWYRWYFKNFIAKVPDDLLRYKYPTRVAFVYDGQRVVSVAGLGGTDTVVHAMNAAGHLVGRSENRKGNFHAFVHRDGRSIDLGTLGGHCSQALDINDQGDVIGVSLNAANMERAFLHRDGQMHDLGSLGGTKSLAVAINNSRQIVGYSYTDKDEIRAFLYQKGQMFDLNRLIAPLKYGVLESADFISERGDIVATAINAHGNRYVVRLRRTGRS